MRCFEFEVPGVDGGAGRLVGTACRPAHCTTRLLEEIALHQAVDQVYLDVDARLMPLIRDFLQRKIA